MFRARRRVGPNVRFQDRSTGRCTAGLGRQLPKQLHAYIVGFASLRARQPPFRLHPDADTWFMDAIRCDGQLSEIFRRALSDGDLTLILANAAHVKKVPGRKTDVADAVWLADLLAHGLIRASFVPGRRPRRCAPCCAPASRWCVSRSVTCNASKRRWRTPTSSSPRC